MSFHYGNPCGVYLIIHGVHSEWLYEIRCGIHCDVIEGGDPLVPTSVPMGCQRRGQMHIYAAISTFVLK